MKSLASDEYYTPAIVIWNKSKSVAKVSITYKLDGKPGGWSSHEVRAGSNLAFRTYASQLKDKLGPHEIIWYCDGVRLGTFIWTVK